MARPVGVFKYSGTIDGISSYKGKHGWITRKKGGPDAEQMKKNPNLVRARENGKEFGACGKAAGWFRRALFPIIRELSDMRMVSRLTKVFLQIKNMDGSSVRGKRNIAAGIMTPGAKDLLKGFDLNAKAALSRVLKKEAILNKVTGEIKIKNFSGKKDLEVPKGATHVRLSGVWLKMDLSDGKVEVQQSNVVERSVGAAASAVILQPMATPLLAGNSFYLLKISFLQEQNGTKYHLKNGEFNSMGILDVD